MKMSRHIVVAALGVAISAAWNATLYAESISVPNHSFESPSTSYVNINIDSWQKSEKPSWYDEGGGFFWTQLTGTFKNTGATSADHIDNCDGEQAIWLFAVPEVGLFQDFDSTDWRNQPPTHAFDATFEIGKAYALTVGVIGGGGNMLPGVTLEIGFYFRDAASNLVKVVSTSITNTTENFPAKTHFVDCQVRVPSVKSGDAWAGQKIGVRMASTVSVEMQGGYWDLDNVRLSATREPTVAGSLSANGQFTLLLQSEPGLVFEILGATTLSPLASNWMSLATITNGTGATPFVDTDTNVNQRFYRARQLP